MKRRWTALAGMLALLLLAGALAHFAGSSPGKSADGFLAESTADPMAAFAQPAWILAGYCG